MRPSKALLCSGLLGLLWSISIGTSKAQQGVLFINEAMASNSQTLLDAHGNSSDWIELYNAGATPISLVGMRISDNITTPAKHIFSGPESELTVPANGFLVIWASGDTALGATHTSFKLAASGGQVLLSSATGILLDMIEMPQQYIDVSYGRLGDGSQSWVFFDEPTPGWTNAETGFAGRMDPPAFSIPAGFHSGTISLSLTHSDPDAVIYYSQDGSVPGPELVGGVAYAYKNIYPTQNNAVVGALVNDTMRAFIHDAPLLLSNPSSQPDHLSQRTSTANHYYPSDHMPQTLSRKAWVVRARAFRSGYLPSEVVSNTYFFTANGQSPYALPVLSLSTERENLFDHFNGIYNPGADHEPWRLANIGAWLNGESPANWRRNSEFPVGVEWFAAGATERAVHRNAGFRLYGNFSRTFRRKSLRLYFRERYGDGDLGYALFPSQTDIDFKRLIVHISGNDDVATNMRDMTLQAMVRHMRVETQDAQPAVVFLDGEFWGVHGMRERYDAKYFERVLGLADNEIDVVERFRHASMGDSLAWSALLDQVTVQDPIDPLIYQDLLTKVDVEDHIDYHVAELFVGNTDWPQNNWKAYRKRTSGFIEGAPHGHDGRWRWLIFDLDWGFNLNMIHPADLNFIGLATLPSGGDNTLLFRRLLRNPDYRNDFITRAADMINTAFRPEVVNGIIEQHRDQIAPDMPEHIQRWPNSPWTVAQWNEKIQVMFDFGAVRAGHFLQEIQNHFNLPAQHQLVVDVSDSQAGWVELNTIQLLPSTHGVDGVVYPWAGTYYETVPVKLTAHAFPGWEFSHWEGALQGGDSLATLLLNAADSITAVFSPVPYCARELLHYWHFNELPSGVLNDLHADLSTMGSALIRYAGEGAGYMDRTPDGEGTTLNGIEPVEGGRALRVRNPSDDRNLLIESPASGSRDLVLSFATHRTSNGPDSQRVSFTIDPERLEWTAITDSYAVPAGYTVKVFSLEGIVATYDNEHLAFKIEFLGPNAGALSGNCRFDNVQINGRPLNTVQAVFCEAGSEFLYEGVPYGMGDHLHMDPEVMDCGHMVLLRVVDGTLDASVHGDGALLTAVVPGISYQWLDCDGMVPVPGADQQVFLPMAAGEYAVHLDNGDCQLVSDCHFSPGDISTGITVYPVPAQDMLQVELHGSFGNATYRLFDAVGRTVRQGDLRSSVNSIGIADLPSGSYMLQVRAENGLQVQQWVRMVLK